MIVDRADGRFLLARLYLDSLRSKQTLRHIQETLDSFPADLNDIYAEAIQRIRSVNPTARVVVLTAFDTDERRTLCTGMTAASTDAGPLAGTPNRPVLRTESPSGDVHIVGCRGEPDCCGNRRWWP